LTGPREHDSQLQRALKSMPSGRTRPYNGHLSRASTIWTRRSRITSVPSGCFRFRESHNKPCQMSGSVGATRRRSNITKARFALAETISQAQRSLGDVLQSQNQKLGPSCVSGRRSPSSPGTPRHAQSSCVRAVVPGRDEDAGHMKRRSKIEHGKQSEFSTTMRR